MIPRRAALAAFAVALSLTNASYAQTFPSRPVKIVLPQPAGTGPDVLARTLAEELAKDLGQPVVVENRPGANGSIAAAYTISQPADGHTLFLAGVSNLSWNPFLYKSLSYNPSRDLMGVALLANTPFVTVASPKLGVRSLPDLIKMAKADPGKISFGSAGVGNSTHLSTELLMARTGIQMLHVPYSGSGGTTVYTGLLSGEPPVLTSVPSDLVPLAKGGKVVPLAVSGEKRLTQLPDVPTFKELGLDIEVPGWYAIVARKGTPAPAVERLNRAINTALESRALRAYLDLQMMQPLSGEASEVDRWTKRDADLWGPIIGKLNIAN